MASYPYDTVIRRLTGVALLLATGWQTVVAAESATEREQLVALTRQLELADRLAGQTATLSPEGQTRYHFDYARLRRDLGRVRAGIQDYLAPPRAQPRDPVPLVGDDARDDTLAHDSKEASGP